MTTQAGSMRWEMRRRGRASLILFLSAAAHLVVLGWFGLKRAAADWRADPPAVNVQLMRLPPPAQPTAKASQEPVSGHASRTASDLSTPPRPTWAGDAEPGAPTSPGLAIDPRWAVDMSQPVPPARREPDYDQFQPCDPLKDPKRESKACRKVDEIAESVGRFYDPQRGKTALAREARRNEALKRYHEAPGTAGYPGLGCAVLHRC